MPGATRPVQGGAYSGPRSEPGGQNTPRAGRVVAAYGTTGNTTGTFAQQVDQGDIWDDALMPLRLLLPVVVGLSLIVLMIVVLAPV
jgi:hypothetical protein